MTLITLPNDHFAVTVPEGYVPIIVDNNPFIGNDAKVVCNDTIGRRLGWVAIGPGSYTLVALGSEISEEQAGEIVEWYTDSDGSVSDIDGLIEHWQTIKNYETGDEDCDSFLESFRSLLASLSLSASTVVIIKQNK